MVRVQCSKCGADIFQENYYSNSPCSKCGNKSGAFIDRETRKLMSDSLNENSKEKDVKMKKEDLKHLEWIYDRMTNVFQLDKNLDYLRRFKEIIDSEKLKEPAQPTIIKSGDTWVAEYDGVDYLYLEQTVDDSIMSDDISYFKKCVPLGTWKPISEIEITDEIAKLRPMVIINYGRETLSKLIYIDYEFVKTMGSSYYLEAGCIPRLATVKDLRS